MATLENKESFIESLKIGINKAIEKECGEQFDKFIEDLKKQKEHVIAGIVLNMAERVSFDTMGRNIIIEIIKTN